MRARTWHLVVSLLAVSLFVLACGGQQAEESSVESIQANLELENGGLEMTDELPMFGLHELDDVDLQLPLELPELPAELETLAGEMGPDPSTDPNAPGDPGTDPNAPGDPGTDPTVPGPLPPPPPDPCPHGLLKGHWKQIKGGYGIIFGKWATANGMLVGHLKGIYGKNLKGEQVFFAKYIGMGGKFAGLIKGRYGKGFFKGRWYGKSGLKGVLIGAYGPAKCVPDAATGAMNCLPGAGNFVGKWKAFCPQCQVNCMPGHVPAPDGKCFCVPAGVAICLMGKCPAGTYCDLCPPLPGCDPSAPCSAVCAPPQCAPIPGSQPPPVPPPPADTEGEDTDSAQPELT
jgi:hypothetical protein